MYFLRVFQFLRIILYSLSLVDEVLDDLLMRGNSERLDLNFSMFNLNSRSNLYLLERPYPDTCHKIQYTFSPYIMWI